MDRPLFDPSRMAAKSAGEVPSPPAADAPLSVSQLAAKVDGVLRTGLAQRVRVIGEVSGFRERTHWYFDLKDAESVINCVMFIQQARRAGFVPEIGRQVIATGRIGFYAKGGKLTLTAELLEPAGAGALELAFRALSEELRRLGWFSVERKRRLPTFPRRVAVVTSRTGAALQDVLDTMRRRCPAVDVAIVDVRVQGDRAKDEVAAALGWLSREHQQLGIDAVILTRGGGSMEDLWAFNERVVAEAVLNCAVPVVAAIGHETDTTIAELVADERAATPTQAAMRLTPDSRALLEQVAGMEGRLRAASARLVRYERERLRSAARHPVFADPAALVRAGREQTENAARHLRSAGRSRLRIAAQRLDRGAARLEGIRPAKVLVDRRAIVGQLEARLRQAVLAAAGERRARLESLARELDAVGPAGVLARGFSVTSRSDGRIVRSIVDVGEGEPIITRVADGAFGSVVGRSEAGSGTNAKLIKTVPIKRPFTRRKPNNPNQMGLFGSEDAARTDSSG